MAGNSQAQVDSHMLRAETVGSPTTSVQVEIGATFLEHFSEQLYSSPQKAFEELISNGWDAGADHVDIRIPSDLSDDAAAMTVFDNGVSMDEQGLRDLWHIAFSTKRQNPVQHGRQVVGKFGIGKLATYVLASHLTYICKAADGKIRRVTMDYGSVEATTNNNKLISQISLDLFEVTPADLESALSELSVGEEIKNLINSGAQTTAPLDNADDEFGAPSSSLVRTTRNTWTLVILSGLKSTGRELKLGVLKRMLEAALPLSGEMVIRINGEALASSKLNAHVAKEWVIGPDLKITEIDLSTDDDDASNEKGKKELIEITSGLTPEPYVNIPGIGKVTGKVKLYHDKISGGKAEERGTSNGFFINVLGRVVNQSDPSFGAENLSHAAWARFRMTVRADGLNPFLNTNREQFKERRALQIFRAFLRKTFNLARTAFDSDGNVEMPDGGDVLVRSLGVVSLAPLRSAVSEALRTQPPIPGLFDDSGISDREQKRTEWRVNTADNIKNALSKVKYERSNDDSFVKFRLSDNAIVINRDHPFVMEHNRTKAEKELMRTIGMVNLLSDVFALESGIEPQKVQNLREYRDQLMRYKAMQRRQSGTHIAKLLLETQNASSNSHRLEAVVGDALRYLGFSVKEIAGSGEPEGIASAYGLPAARTQTESDPKNALYDFTYDAKSSKHDRAQTGNVSLDGINEHRIRYNADYALVIAPGYQDGALAVRCEQQKITPMKAFDLGRLLEITVEYGAIPLDQLEGVFKFHHPDEVSSWVDSLRERLSKSRRLTIDLFLKALEALRGKVPDALEAGLIAFTCRDRLGAPTVVNDDVIRLVRGLQILIPDLIGIDEGNRIIVNASSERVAAAVASQLEKLQIDVDDENHSEAAGSGAA